MKITQDDMNAAVNAKLINADQARNLWIFWERENENVPQFRLAHLLYYFGGLIAISAVTLFVTQAWDRLKGIPLFIISSLLFILGILLTHQFLKKKHPIPAGIMATFALALIPLLIFNLQVGLGYLPPHKIYYRNFHTLVNWYWMPMEVLTLITGVILLYIYRFPFLLFPISVTLWYMSMDLFPLFFGMDNFDFLARANFSIYFGLLIIAAAIYMDFKHSTSKKDYAFWLYIFGVLTFWGGLTVQDSNSELSKLFYCLINVAMIFISIFLNRRVFAVFGALGVLGYLGHLAFQVFGNSLLFPIVLVFLGLIIIVIGTRWVKLENSLNTKIKPYLPKKFREK